ncbi:MAG: hypothetical protein WD114_02480, partial [Phycisphaerales bacterium]
MKQAGRTEQQGARRRGPMIGWPVAHLLALAPLDVWIRLLHRSRSVPPRYWPRMVFVLFTSFVGTV